MTSKTLVITGGSRGIGAKTVERFLDAGFRVINLSRTNHPAADVININMDLANKENILEKSAELTALVKAAEQICLVHNAALYFTDKIGETNTSRFEEMMRVNVEAPLILNNILVPFLQPTSSIIYIGSTISDMAVKNYASYIISKHAVLGMMRATCQDLADKQIHTACICPGFVNTEMVAKNLSKAFIESKVIAKRLIEPEEIAEFIYTVMQSPILNGSLLHANLGQVMT